MKKYTKDMRYNLMVQRTRTRVKRSFDFQIIWEAIGLLIIVASLVAVYVLMA